MTRNKLSKLIVVSVLALFGIGGIAGGAVAVTMVNDNLTEQHIVFGEDTEWAGEQVTNGLEAYRFQGVIADHVAAALEPAGFSTYEEVSGAARASVTEANPTGDPKLQALRRTALDGQLLRGTLFSSFAWWLVGWIGIAAGAAFLLLSGAVFLHTGRTDDTTIYFPAAERIDEGSRVSV